MNGSNRLIDRIESDHRDGKIDLDKLEIRGVEITKLINGLNVVETTVLMLAILDAISNNILRKTNSELLRDEFDEAIMRRNPR